MDSITIRTAKDFTRGKTPSKRKKHLTTACESCRRLKVRCSGPVSDSECTSQDPKVCSRCVKLGKICSWPEDDGRKRPRTRFNPQSAWIDCTSPRNAQMVDFAEGHLPEVKISNSQDLEDPQPPSSASLPIHDTDSSGVETSSGSGRPHNASGRMVDIIDGQGIPYRIVQYYRHLGPTAIAPGYKKISLKVTNEDESFAGQGSTGETHERYLKLPMFDALTGLPDAKILGHLLDAFFEFYGDNYCFLNRSHLEDLIARRDVSEFLISAISALSSRFCQPEVFDPYFPPLPDGRARERWEYSLPFLDQAKKLLMPLISVPSCEIVAGLLFLALADFGDNDEAGMWMFTGMSLRMAQELGLHRERPCADLSAVDSVMHKWRAGHSSEPPTPSLATPPKGPTFEESAEVILFWCVFVQDACLSNGTGRVPSIKQDDVNIRLPTDLDVATVKAGPGKSPQLIERTGYSQMVRMMVEYAQSIEILNTDSRGKTKQLLLESSRRLESIEKIRDSLTHSYKSIPQCLQMSAVSYQTAVNSSQAGPYLVMHLNYHLQIAFLTQESLSVGRSILKSSPEDLSTNSGFLPPSVNRPKVKADEAVYRNAMKSVVDLLTFAKFIDCRPLWSTFFLNQSFFHTACAYMSDMLQLQHKHEQIPADGEGSPFPIPSHTSPSLLFNREDFRHERESCDKPSAAEEYLAVIAKTNYHFLRQAVKDMATYYAGAGWVDAVLDQRETGLRDVDLSIVSESISTFIRLRDLRGGLTKRTNFKETANGASDDEGPGNAADEFDNASWLPELLSDAPLDFDSQAFFDDYMLAELSKDGDFQF